MSFYTFSTARWNYVTVCQSTFGWLKTIELRLDFDFLGRLFFGRSARSWALRFYLLSVESCSIFFIPSLTINRTCNETNSETNWVKNFVDPKRKAILTFETLPWKQTQKLLTDTNTLVIKLVIFLQNLTDVFTKVSTLKTNVNKKLDSYKT